MEHLAALIEVGDALVQPFEPSVTDGERSLLYLGGQYSHAVRKMPADGDFRVQTSTAGSNLPHRRAAAELAAAQAALDRRRRPSCCTPGSIWSAPPKRRW